MKAQVTRKRFKLHKSFFMDYGKFIARFNLFTIRTSINIFGTEKCKVTFGLKYILNHFRNRGRGWVREINLSPHPPVIYYRPFQGVNSVVVIGSPYEPLCEKTGLRGFRPGPTQHGLYSHRRWLEAWNFGCR